MTGHQTPVVVAVSTCIHPLRGIFYTVCVSSGDSVQLVVFSTAVDVREKQSQYWRMCSCCQLIQVVCVCVCVCVCVHITSVQWRLFNSETLCSGASFEM